MLNPDKYVAQTKPSNSSAINPDLFDDDLEDADSNDGDTGSDQSSQDQMSPIIPRRKTRSTKNDSLPVPPDSSFEVSIEQQSAASPKQLTHAEAREKQIEDEIVRYANFSKTEFTAFCNSRGLTRKNNLKFEPIGAITWEWWRLKKAEYPIIYAAIKTVLQAPTSSSAVERLFSRVSAYTTNQKNRFKSKNLMALLQIGEMDTFQRVSADIFLQNGIQINTELENRFQQSNLNAESDDSDSSDIDDFDELFSVTI